MYSGKNLPKLWKNLLHVFAILKQSVVSSAELLKNSFLSVTRHFNYRTHNSPHLVHILSQMNSIEDSQPIYERRLRASVGYELGQ